MYLLDIVFDGVFIVNCYLLIRCNLFLTIHFLLMNDQLFIGGVFLLLELVIGGLLLLTTVVIC